MSEPLSGNIKSNLENNHVGSLQELCVARHCLYPTYTFNEILNESDRKFTVVCSISSYKVSGTGKTKKAAKQQAAYLMFKIIVKLTPLEINHISNQYNDNSAGESMPEKLPSNIPFLKFQKSLTQLNMFFEQKKSNTIPCLNQNDKDSNKSEITAFKVLNYIAYIEDVSVKHNIVLPKPENEEVDVLMELTTYPRIVGIGTGNDKLGGVEAAALCILSFMKSLIDNS